MSDDDERTTINKRLIKHSSSSPECEEAHREKTQEKKPHSAHLSEFTSSVKLIGTQTNSLPLKMRIIYISYASTSSSVERRVIGIARKQLQLCAAVNSSSFSWLSLFVSCRFCRLIKNRQL